MKIFKFGGASVKDADSVKNLAQVLKLFPADELIVVVSAMGKTTNALEKLAEDYYYTKGNSRQILSEVKKYHFDIVEQIFTDKTHAIYNEINNSFVELDWLIEGVPSQTFDHVYDQIVCMGEIISTKIVSAYLNTIGITNKWEDVRDYIKTDDTFREGVVNWELTESLSRSLLKRKQIIVTQGFIGGTSENYTTTLGREGSDYTAAILAYCTNAESVTIWKDVPGVLNADPKWFDDTQLIEQLSYLDAIELAYYGATVIHPKTIKPLQNKNIPLYVRSFINPEAKGTVISDAQLTLPVPCFIFKVNQVLLSISPKDFSFIVEQNLSDIFKLFADNGVKINTMQSTAISFSVCVNIHEHKTSQLVKKLQENYRVLYNDGLELITIRYYNQATIDRVTAGKKILLEVKSRYTVQLVVKNA
ncbi:MAG: aspartate kinase [Bacteroidia bacterium]|nr:aspartate kinase [Bacteroidia bacterium]